MQPLLKTVILGIVFAALALHSSAAQGRDTLTLEQALAIAREHSPALTAAENNIRANGLAHDAIAAERLPQAGIAAEASYAPEDRVFGYDPVISNGGTLSGQVAVEQSVYDGGVRSLKLQQLDREGKRLLREKTRIERNLVYGVKQAFIEALRAQQETQLEQESVDILASYIGLVNRLYAGGTVPYTDVLQTQIQLTQAQTSYDEAVVDFTAARYALAEAIGMPADTAAGLRGSLEATAADSAAAFPGIDQNLDLAVAGLEIETNALNADIARHESYPIISLVADFGYLSSVENLRLPPAEKYNALGYSVGVTVEMPLFTWGATGMKIEQQQLATENLRLQHEQLKRSLTAAYAKAETEYRHAWNRLGAVRQNVSRAEENYLLVKAQYAGGSNTALDVLTAAQFLVDTKRAEVQTLAAIHIARITLEQMTTP